MTGPWTTRRFLTVGLPLFAAGLALLAFEYTSESDIELISLPLLLTGVFLLFEGYIAWRRSRLGPTDNPK